MSEAEPAPPRITRALIFAVVAAEAGLTLEDLTGRSRQRPIMEARKIAMYLAATMTPSALRSIGEDMGGRDYSTVLFARMKIKEREAKDPALCARLAALRDDILRQAQESRKG